MRVLKWLGIGFVLLIANGALLPEEEKKADEPEAARAATGPRRRSRLSLSKKQGE